MTASITRDELVYGFTAEPGLVALEHIPGETEDVMRLFIRKKVALTTRDEPFNPFVWLTKADWLKDFSPEPAIQQLAGRNPLRVLARFSTWNDLERALAHLRKTTSRTPSDPSAPYMVLRDPVQQFLLDTGRTSFRDMLLPDLQFLFLDIETDCAANRDFSNAARAEDRILSIALSDGRGMEELLVLDGKDEKALLEQFVEVFTEQDPDVLVGHNIFKFDLPYIETRAKRHKVALTLGRNGKPPSSHSSRFSAAERTLTYPRYHLNGRHVVDTYLLSLAYDVSFRALENHSLKTVAKHFGVAADDRVYIDGHQIAKTFRQHPDRFKKYALDDIRETAAITPILLNACFAQSQILPLPLETVCVRGNAGKIESLLIREYLRTRHSLPAPMPAQSFEGAYTDIFFEGLAKPIQHCDVRSLYPSILLLEKRNPRHDTLGVFLQLLSHLRDFRVEAKQKAQTARSQDVAERWNALQTTFKILINSFYGYLGFAQGCFNDYELAAHVTERGRHILRDMVEQLRKMGTLPIEIDTDGIYFTPPSSVTTPAEEEHFQIEFKKSLPKGIEVEFDGRYVAMFSYKMKNYALLEEDGTVIIKGAALKSRGLEPFLRTLLREWLTLTLHGRTNEIQPLFQRWREDIAKQHLPIELLAKTEILSDSPATYQRKREAPGKSRQPAYEVALASGRAFQAGDAVTYYVTGVKKNVPVYANAKLAIDFDPKHRDENVAYYLGKLDALEKKLDTSPPITASSDEQPTLF